MIIMTALIATMLATPDSTDRSWWESSCEREKTTTAEERKAVRKRMFDACRSLGAKPDVCEMLDAVVMRESDGRADVKHTLGKNEDGLGPIGASVKYHLAKWDPAAPREVLCIPEPNTVIGLRIWREAVRTYKGKIKLDLQRVFAGRFYDVGKPPLHKLDVAWCKRLARRGQSCLDRVTLKDLGKGPTVAEQEAWLQERLAKVGKDGDS